MNKDKLHDIIKSAILGQMIGEAVGFAYSGKSDISMASVTMIEGPNEEEPGTYAASSALSLCTMASINELNAIEPDDIVNKFNDFILGGYLAATEECPVSNATVSAVKNYLNGMPADRCGFTENEYNDAECLARILPVSLFCSPGKIETCIEQSHKVCRITHPFVSSQVVCALYSLIIRNLLLQKAEKVFDILEQYYKSNNMQDFEKELSLLETADEVLDKSENVKSPAYCFWKAWQAYTKYENDFRLCVSYAISEGGETSYIGSIVGGISGLVNEFTNMPRNWLNTIKLSTEVMEVIDNFTDNLIKKFEGNNV